ncbi:nicotinamidase-related amidase [Streptosporangium becharense]|uniref:Nicotinamidase-related amidase n=1 Tax=Streptosporangium becharense TaxID=1816182 RepID=A0A7W9MEA1_9ACTN|nr:isochorismatase family cysteine hydrolase [Streptosporangium becharense]MBB2913686.1 nicotinamidase-related amidase [Streptosporangium becharense]MBB5817767.1 nicotinamidase-related amidase [Streptosporangium becharense]
MGKTAVIVIDMLNPYDHEDADLLERNVAKIVDPLGGLIGRAHEREDVELVFVNDNHGDFSATRDDIEALARKGRRPDLVNPLLPPPGCAFLTKVRHSAFFGTSLEYLLHRREIETVVLTGQVTEQCVLYSALDAYVRHFAIRIPRDCVAHIHDDLGEAALRMMERNMGAEITTAERCLPGG